MCNVFVMAQILEISMMVVTQAQAMCQTILYTLQMI